MTKTIIALLAALTFDCYAVQPEGWTPEELAECDRQWGETH